MTENRTYLRNLLVVLLVVPLVLLALAPVLVLLWVYAVWLCIIDQGPRHKSLEAWYEENEL